MAVTLDRAKLMQTADWLAVAVAASLPWSTSATGILAVLWLVTLVPAIDWRELRQIAMTPAGGLPVLLVVFGAAGMAWADVTLAERWGGFTSFAKLLVIPLLLVQFRRSDRGLCVFGGFLVSCTVLLIVSSAIFVWPNLWWPVEFPGVPVKNAATQSGEFVACIFGLLYLAADYLERHQRRRMIAALVVALAMLANMVYVSTGRTALAIIPVLLIVFAFKRLNAKGAAVLLATAIVVAAIGWFSSPYLRTRATTVWTEIQGYEASGARSSSGERLAFWTKSLAFVREAPVIGHGTGSIHALFIASSAGQTGAAASATTNPHNQTFAVAIQLGLAGALVLWAMWLAHLLLFRGQGLAQWIGLVIVVQNIVGSLFNSHLFDFVQGWIYVVGVGVAGGMALKRENAKRPQPMSRIDLPARPRILVIALRRLGDVLLTTPLIRSLRRAWPDAIIDALVFADTAGILQGNPDLNGIVTMAPKPTAAQSLALAARLWRKYDLAISTQTGDRPTLFAFVAARRRVGQVEGRFGGRLKQQLMERSVAYESGVHRVEAILRLVDGLGIARIAELVAPAARDVKEAPAGDYAVIHAAPMFRYKQWTESGWRELAAALAARGLTVIATGGPSPDERDYLDKVWRGTDVARVDGALDWPQLSGLLANARVFVGPDTSVTHLAAASGAPTIALYGPTDPRLWGPWPAGGLDSTWADTGKIQRRGNVFLVQNVLPCMPCQLEGCERRLDSASACLDELPAAQVIGAVDQALAAFPARSKR